MQSYKVNIKFCFYKLAMNEWLTNFKNSSLHDCIKNCEVNKGKFNKWVKSKFSKSTSGTQMQKNWENLKKT